MIRSPLGLRLNPGRPIREQIREAATLGAKGVVLDAVGDLAPERLSETGRRDLRQMLRSVELSLVAVGLPTRRPFDTTDQLEDRLRRAEGAFAMAFELGARLVLARMGELPPETDATRRETWIGALRELSRRADHRGIRFTVETGTEPGAALRPILDGLDTIGVAASIDPASLLVRGFDPMETTRALGPWVAHAYLNDAASAGTNVTVFRSRGDGFPPNSLDWEEYLGGFEEINYRGFLTIWPDPAYEPGPKFLATAERLKRL
ncbi:Sugar phosphate isomerase/epimerase [Singulisphaera sp. GP187]|uniref:sugar phosphate isomerase/epimerase family protein n=1 Tax=Singulisphaera sp. GP187 TaxID=1882752 RepID=UPI00092C48B9|nr:TIM barrel protein [Singulisphaera sp. GP187]SIO06398.1 Sugar phosphate isomerase/epimerase [Singulisphaera sp. GP187]